MTEPMRWEKLGLIFPPPTDLNWMVSHCMTPFAEARDGYHRVYFVGRDAKARGRIGYFDVDIERPHTVLRVSKTPVIDLGPRGAYDDSGVTSTWIVNVEGRRFHYFNGWSLGTTVPFYFFIGLAISDDGETYGKVSRAPVLDRSDIDPFLTGSPCILIEDGRWRMWYVSCREWSSVAGEHARHYYHIRYAESHDGVTWRRDGTVCIDFAGEEYAFSRPCVVKDGGLYRMWYSYRGETFRIGYAESRDGVTWERLDHLAGIDVSESGWDSEMIEYGHVFDHNGSRYMLYNGNGYGRTGIGLAILRKGQRA